MTRSIAGLIGAAMIFAVPLATPVSAAAPAPDGTFTVAQTVVPAKCAQIKDPRQRAACIKQETGK
jgi:hypothetical protein